MQEKVWLVRPSKGWKEVQQRVGSGRGSAVWDPEALQGCWPLLSEPQELVKGCGPFNKTDIRSFIHIIK